MIEYSSRYRDSVKWDFISISTARADVTATTTFEFGRLYEWQTQIPSTTLQKISLGYALSLSFVLKAIICGIN